MTGEDLILNIMDLNSSRCFSLTPGLSPGEASASVSVGVRVGEAGVGVRVGVCVRARARACVVILALAIMTACSPKVQLSTTLSPECQKVLDNLDNLDNRILFGHQDATAYGVGWSYTDSTDKCDVRDVCGDYPAVYGWDIGHIELDDPANLDTVWFSLMKKLIREAHTRGGLITISWHLDNPVSGGNAWDTTRAVNQILPGQPFYARYASWVGKVAGFLGDLKDDAGQRIPVFFRPFHEMSGKWFWWGYGNCTPDEYKALWKETVRLLRDQYHLDNLIFVYSTDKVRDAEHYLTWYPGDEWVDMLGIDVYDRDGSVENYTNPLRNWLTMLKTLAAGHEKPFALTETGFESIPLADWWTGRLLPGIKDTGIAWVLVWRNANTKHHYAPYPGDVSADDFVKFHGNAAILFETEWATLR